ncbi:MAG TPA: sugar phosphate isomerase/epimerase family protein [Candidatus Baltobacteraceae bacterium]|nr:sugar phosphate isomerase/epimerase family protein [Candidatus Baltobacteraceae bacterium]
MNRVGYKHDIITDTFAKFTRREMIRRTTRFGAALALGSAVAPLFAAPEGRGFKIGAPEWSLRKTDPGCFEVAREIGLDGVQVNLGSLSDHMHLRQPAVQQAYLAAARQYGMEIASLAVAELNSIPLKSDPRAAVWLIDSLDVARALGVRVILVAEFGNGELKGDNEGIDRTVELLKEIAPRAEKAGAILGLENYLSAPENLDILQRVGSPAVQVYYDVGNSTDKGYDIYQEIRMLKGHICEFHAKDGNFMLGQGRIDFHKVRQAMDDIDYRGWIEIEAAAPHSLVEDYRADLKFLKPIFPA